jgi:hypothetical protein
MIENRVHYFNTFCHFLIITNKKLNKPDRSSNYGPKTAKTVPRTNPEVGPARTDPTLDCDDHDVVTVWQLNFT